MSFELLPFQQQVKDFIVAHPFAGIYLSMGGGKTLTTLASLQEIRPSGHILVVAPVKIARSTWLDEIEKHKMPVRTRSLIYNENDKKLTRAKRLQRYAETLDSSPGSARMFFINQELLHDLVEWYETQPDPVTGRKGAAWPFPTVIIDESQGFKSAASRRFKRLKKVRPQILRLIELTGTPAPNGLLDLWSQIALLDQGMALGLTLTEYKARYFTPSKFIEGRAVDWDPLPGAKEAIYERVRHLVMSAENTKLPLPPVLPPQDVMVHLDKDTMQAYKDFKRQQVLDLVVPDPQDPKKFTITADSQGVLHGRLLQFASGTMYVGENHDLDFVGIHQEKVEVLDYLIRNNNGSPVLVPYRFRSDKAVLMEELTARGYHVEVFDGSRDMTRRWNDKQIPVMLLQPASAGHGVNLQHGGHTIVWYTLPDSLEHYLQTNARLARMGQAETVEIYRLITKGTRDERLPRSLAFKEALQQDFLSAVAMPPIDEFEDIYEDLGDLDLL